MNMKRNLSLLLTGIIFVGSGFLAGYLIGNVVYTPPSSSPVQTVQPIPTQEAVMNTVVAAPIEEPTPEPEYYGIRYLVILEDRELCLYEVDGQNRNLLKKTKINPQLFPAKDMSDMKNGINTGTKEGALELFENFIS